MQCLILGVGDAFTERHFSTSALINAGRGFVLIDCPDLIHRVLHEAMQQVDWNATVANIDDIILTHLHGDHCNGLESFGFKRRVLRESDPSITRPRLHCSPPVAERLWQRLGPAMDGSGPARPDGSNGPPTRSLDEFYELRIIKPGEAVTIGGLHVECRFTKHSISTIGLRISDDKHMLGWSGDTPFEPAHIDWLNEADVIVHECNRGPAHTAIADLNALPDDVRQKMRLIHLPDDFDQSRTDIAVLRQGELVEFG